MKAHYLGHVVFYVKDLQRSLSFPRDLLGFPGEGGYSINLRSPSHLGERHHEILLDPSR